MQLTGKARKAYAHLLAAATSVLLTFQPSPVFQDLPELAQQYTKILIRAANRVGKTRHCAWVAAKRMVEHPGSRVRVIGPTNKHCQTVLGKYLAEFLKPYLTKKSYYVEGRGWNGGRSKVITLRNGSVCELLSLEDKPDAHSGASCHLVIFDEPPSLAHFTENIARLVDTRGTVIVAATMVNRPVRWLREMVQGEDGDAPPGVTEHTSTWLQIVAEFSLANCPWYNKEQAEEWLATMELTPWEKGQRVHASWEGVTAQRALVGVGDRNFSREPPTGDVLIGLGIDHGDLAGHQTCVAVAFKGHRIWTLDEYRSATATTPEEDSKAIQEMLQRHGMDLASVDLAVGDIGHVRGFTGWKINDAMMMHMATLTGSSAPPFEIKTPDKTPGSVEWGWRCVNYAGRRGDLRIHPRCLNVAAGVRHWKGGRKGPDGDLSHTLDALRYILVTAIGHHKHYAKLRFT